MDQDDIDVEGEVAKRKIVTWEVGGVWILEGYDYPEQVKLIGKEVHDHFASDNGDLCLNSWRTDNAGAKPSSKVNEQKESVLDFRCTSISLKGDVNLNESCPVRVRLKRDNKASKSEWTLTHLVYDHGAGCNLPTRQRHLKSAWFVESEEIQHLTQGNDEQVKNAFIGSKVKPTHANAKRISSDMRYGERDSWIERTFAFPSLIWKLQENDPDGLYLLETSPCPMNIPNVAPGSAKTLQFVFVSPSTSKQICNTFNNVVSSMDSAFRKHATGGVEYVLSMKNGMGSNTLLAFAYFHNESMHHWDVWRELLARSGIWMSVTIADWHPGIVNVFDEWTMSNLEDRERRTEVPAVDSPVQQEPPPNAAFGNGRLTRKSAAAAAAAASAAAVDVPSAGAGDASDAATIPGEVRGVHVCAHCLEKPTTGRWARGNCNCTLWWCEDELQCLEARIAHRVNCVPRANMFDPRNPLMDPHSPCPSGFRCGLHFARDLNVEKLGKGLLQQTALSTNHSMLLHNLEEVKRELGNEVYEALMKMKYRIIWLYQLDYLARGETTLAEWTNNVSETENWSHNVVRQLDPLQGLIETLDKSEKKNNLLLLAASKEKDRNNRVSFHAKARVAAKARQVETKWTVKEVSRVQLLPYATINVKLSLRDRPTVTKLVCLDLNPNLQYWYERCTVFGDFGSRLWGMPCKYCSYVLFYMTSIIRDYYQENAVLKANQLNKDDRAMFTSLMHIDNPAFYESLFHLDLIVAAYSNLPTLVTDFNPQEQPKHLLIYRQGQINKQLSRFKKGVVPYPARKLAAQKLDDDLERRDHVAQIACSGHDVVVDLSCDNAGELGELLARRSAHAAEEEGDFDFLDPCKL